MPENPVASYSGDALMTLGGGFLTGAIVAEAFGPSGGAAYAWLSMLGASLLALGFALKFMTEDWML